MFPGTIRDNVFKRIRHTQYKHNASQWCLKGHFQLPAQLQVDDHQQIPIWNCLQPELVYLYSRSCASPDSVEEIQPSLQQMDTQALAMGAGKCINLKVIFTVLVLFFLGCSSSTTSLLCHRASALWCCCRALWTGETTNVQSYIVEL